MHLLHVEGQAVSQRLSDITIDFEYVIIEELTDKGLMWRLWEELLGHFLEKLTQNFENSFSMLGLLRKML